MSFFDVPGFYWNPVQYVSEYIDEWSAKGCSSEKDCEDSLYLFLHDRLPKLQIVKQYGRGRSHVDLLIQDKVMVELKYNLTSTGEYQRLIGQLVDYKDWGKQFILVLVGEIEPNLFKQIQKELERQFSVYSSFDETTRLILKVVVEQTK